jgi:5-methylcytosine-specific restriction endonuclease McrA
LFKNLERSGIIKLEKSLNSGFNYVVCKQEELIKHFKSKFPNPIYKPINGASKYRETARANKPKKCERCGYDKYPDILEVHHKDRVRKNGESGNLELLCPNCHTEEHN